MWQGVRGPAHASVELSAQRNPGLPLEAAGRLPAQPLHWGARQGWQPLDQARLPNWIEVRERPLGATCLGTVA